MAELNRSKAQSPKRAKRPKLWDKFNVYWLGSAYFEEGQAEITIVLKYREKSGDRYSEDFHRDVAELIPMPTLHPAFRNGSIVISDPDGMERTVQRHWKQK